MREGEGRGWKKVRTNGNLTDGTLAYASVGNDVSLLVWLELLDSMYPPVDVLALRLVDPAICSRGDEAENGVLVGHPFARCVAFGAVHAHGITDKEVVVHSFVASKSI